MKIIVFIITLAILTLLSGLITLSVAPLLYDPLLYPFIAADVLLLQFIFILFSYTVLLICTSLSASFRSLDSTSLGLYCLAFTLILYFILYVFTWGTNFRSLLLFMLSTGFASCLIPKIHSTFTNYGGRYASIK